MDCAPFNDISLRGDTPIELPLANRLHENIEQFDHGLASFGVVVMAGNLLLVALAIDLKSTHDCEQARSPLAHRVEVFS